MLTCWQSTDLGHFVVLFGLVFLGYSCCGVLLFGHQMAKFATLADSVVECMMILLALDGEDCCRWVVGVEFHSHGHYRTFAARNAIRGPIL